MTLGILKNFVAGYSYNNVVAYILLLNVVQQCSDILMCINITPETTPSWYILSSHRLYFTRIGFNVLPFLFQYLTESYLFQ